MSDELVRLQEWYAAQCEEIVEGKTPWQHRHAIAINTSDNPAWNVGIDLAGTDLDGVSMPPYELDNGDDDWAMCSIVNNQFNGIGDPPKLVDILNLFFTLKPGG